MVRRTCGLAPLLGFSVRAGDVVGGGGGDGAGILGDNGYKTWTWEAEEAPALVALRFMSARKEKHNKNKKTRKEFARWDFGGGQCAPGNVAPSDGRSNKSRTL